MIPVTIATRRGPLTVQATYRADVWAVTPQLGARRRPLKTRFVVSHAPTGLVCNRDLDPLNHEAAIVLCRSLAAEFPGFLADHGTVEPVVEGGYRPPGLSPDESRAMGQRVRELYELARRAGAGRKPR